MDSWISRGHEIVLGTKGYRWGIRISPLNPTCNFDPAPDAGLTYTSINFSKDSVYAMDEGGDIK